MARRRTVTIRDIAREAGVSPTTVSAALRKDGGHTSIGDETRRRVLEIAERVGYDFSRLRPTVPEGKHIATFWPEGLHPVEPMRYAMVFELSERLARNGYAMLVHKGCDEPHQVDALIGEVFSNGIRGVIVVETLACVEHLPDWPIPSVYIGVVPEGSPFAHVSVDDHLGGRLAAEHLLALGHRDIAIVRPRIGEWSLRREHGVRAALEANNLHLPAERVVTVGKVLEGQMGRVLPQFLASDAGRAVTGLVCDSDWAASYTLRALRGIGVRVPEDMSVIGYDDAHYACLVDPPLTTIRQRFVEMGALAGGLLLEQIHTGERTAQSMMVPPELVVRSSTGPFRR